MGETIRKALGRVLAEELDARAARGDLRWKLETHTGRLVYVIDSGPAWADQMPTLRMTPGETYDWLGLGVTRG